MPPQSVGMRGTGRRISIVLGLLVAAGCTGTLNCGFTQTDVAVVEQWLRCVECSDGELAALTALHARRPGRTTSALRTALVAGPQDTALARAQFERAFDRIVAADSGFLQSGRPAANKQEYVQHYLDAYELTTRLRAASALAVLDGVAAIPILQQAASDSFPADSAQLRFLIDSVAKPPTSGPQPVRPH